MKHLKRFNESDTFNIASSKDEYNAITDDIRYILQDIVDEGYTLNISSYKDSVSIGYSGGLSLVFRVSIELIRGSRSKWISMGNKKGLVEDEINNTIDVKDTLLQLNSYLSDYDCKLMVMCHTISDKGEYISTNVDKVSDNQLWSRGLFMQIIKKEKKNWISKIFSKK